MSKMCMTVGSWVLTIICLIFLWGFGGLAGIVAGTVCLLGQFSLLINQMTYESDVEAKRRD